MRIGGLFLSAMVLVPTLKAAATTVDLSTSNASNWKVTGGGAVNAPAFAYAPLSGISMSSTAFANGTFATGGSAATLNGFWYADTHFTLPSNATGVSLIFSNFQADDRGVLELNGIILGDYFLNGSESNPPLTGIGKMSFLPGPPDVSYTFTGINSGTVTSGFILGGDNDLRMIINNTGIQSLSASTTNFSVADSTHADVTASVTFVPEPASLAILSLGVAAMMTRRRARSK